MPKIVDHDQRRREILEATWRVIANKGIEAATIREIARETGYSNGVLSHYFTNKEDILISAHKLAFQRVYDRASAADAGTLVGMALLRRSLYEALPLDEERRIEAVLDVSFWSQALVNPHLREIRRESIAEGRAWWMAMIDDAKERAEVSTAVPSELMCDEIQALIDGLSVEAVLYPDDMNPERQQAIADAYLDRWVE